MASLSVLASQTGSCSIFRSSIDWSVPFSHFKCHHCVQHSEKPPSCDYDTNQEAGKYWRFLFGKGNRKWRHFGLHRCMKPPSCENGTNQSIKGKRMLTLPVWHGKVTTDTTYTNIVMVYNNTWHNKEDNSHKIGKAGMKIRGLEFALSQSMCAQHQWW